MKPASFLVLSLLLSLGAERVVAATDTWNGGGGASNANWNNSANWSGVTVATGDIIVFDGTTSLAANNNLSSSSFTFAGLTFNDLSGAFVLTGNGVKMSGNITDSNAEVIETIDFSTGSQFSSTNKQISVTGGGTLAFESTIQGTTGFSKTGNGTLILSGGNSGYSGATTVTAGTLLANSATSSTGTGALTVTSGGTLGGSGTINTTGANKITVSGHLAAGTPGNLNTLTLSAASNTAGTGFLTLTNAALDFNLGAANASSMLSLTSSFANEVTGLSGNAFNFSDLTSGSLSGGRYTLFQTDSTANAFSGLSLGVLSGFTLNGLSAYTAAGDTVQLELNQLGGTGDYALQLDIVPAPEPSAWGLCLFGCGLLLWVGRHRFSRLS